MGTREGSIMATIIITHINTNEAAAPSQVCPGILIHAIDMVQPPGIAMPPDMDSHQRIVPQAPAMNRSALIPRNPHSRAQPMPCTEASESKAVSPALERATFKPLF
jgi:hypothetical protein